MVRLLFESYLLSNTNECIKSEVVTKKSKFHCFYQLFFINIEGEDIMTIQNHKLKTTK